VRPPGLLAVASWLAVSAGAAHAQGPVLDHGVAVLQGLDKVTARVSTIRAASDVDGAPVDLFAGWMFASSPAVSALEHPVYDIWVIDCAEPVAPTEGIQGVPETTAPASE
jgi:hypothetical protein